MRLGDRESWLELEHVESEPRGACLAVTVAGPGYSGKDRVWFREEDLRTFTGELAELEHRRQGKATLCSATPDALRLEFQATDRHLEVVGHLGWKTPNVCAWRLQFGLEFPSDRVPGLLQFFRSLA